MRSLRFLEPLLDRLEELSAVDGVTQRLTNLGTRVIPRGRVRDVLSGTPIGHPLHPLLVALPIGSWAVAPLLDAVGEGSAARRVTGFGCVAALPAAAAGLNDWLSTDGAERRVGFGHALLNDVALSAYAGSWLARRRGHRSAGVAAGLAGAVCLAAAGYLGGHLVYAQGVGVDTTAFLQVPTQWTDAGAEADLPAGEAIKQVIVNAIPLLIARRGEEVIAMLDRCTHRGGPLSEGTVSDGCVTCPWHGSAFALDDGAVTAGPATRRAPLLQTRLRDGRLEVRRHEPRSLRTNPVGS